ncbi:YdcF family protein [Clostridium chauvoei]|nr:YdcF family protein [Clostridium chauvoei]MBX7313803.1 YdcF family protein [Clostridium chauvoei]
MIDIILGIILCIYFIVINLFVRKVSFSFIFLIVGVALIIYHFIKDKIKRNKNLNKIFNIGKIVGSICLVIFIIIEGAIILYPKRDKSEADYMIILGAGIRGEKLSITLEQRLEKAIEYINNYDEDINVVVSGGQGPGEDITEAEAMKRYLISNGINENKIIMENKSTSTSENLIYSKAKIEQSTGEKIDNIKIKVVTSDFHALRSNMLAKKNGYEDISFYTNTTVITLMPIMYTR